ncbi:serine/arginine repetitive matrix protein 2-like [Argonauta hians]
MRNSVPIFFLICCYFMFLHGCHSEHVLSRNARELPGGTEHDYSPGKMALKIDDTNRILPSMTTQYNRDNSNHRHENIRRIRKQQVVSETIRSNQRQQIDKTRRNSLARDRSAFLGARRFRDSDSRRRVHEIRSEISAKRENIGDTRRNLIVEDLRRQRIQSVDARRIQNAVEENSNSRRNIDQRHRNSFTLELTEVSRSRRSKSVETARIRTQEIRKEISNVRREIDTAHRNNVKRESMVTSRRERSRSTDTTRRMRETMIDISNTRQEMGRNLRKIHLRNARDTVRNQRSRSLDSLQQIQVFSQDTLNTRRKAHDVRRVSQSSDILARRSRSVDSSRRFEDNRQDTLYISRQMDRSRRNSLIETRRSRSVYSIGRAVRREVSKIKPLSDDARRNSETVEISKIRSERRIESTRTTQRSRNEISNARLQIRRNSLSRDSSNDSQTRRSRLSESRIIRLGINQEILNTRRRIDENRRNDLSHRNPSISRTVASSRRFDEISKAKKQIDDIRRNTFTRDTSGFSGSLRSRSVGARRLQDDGTRKSNSVRSRSIDSSLRILETRRAISSARHFTEEMSDARDVTPDKRRIKYSTQRHLAVRDMNSDLFRFRASDKNRNSFHRNVRSQESRHNRENRNSISISFQRKLFRARITRETGEKMSDRVRQMDSSRRNTLLRESRDVSRNERSNFVNSIRKSRQESDTFVTRNSKLHVRQQGNSANKMSVIRETFRLTDSDSRKIRNEASSRGRQVDKYHRVVYESRDRRQESRSVEFNTNFRQTRRVRDAREETAPRHLMQRIYRMGLTYNPTSHNQKSIYRSRQQVRDKLSDPQRQIDEQYQLLTRKETSLISENRQSRFIDSNQIRVRQNSRLTSHIRREVANTRRNANHLEARRNSQLNRSRTIISNSFRASRMVNRRSFESLGNIKQFSVSSPQNFQFDLYLSSSRDDGVITVISLENNPLFTKQSSNNSLLMAEHGTEIRTHILNYTMAMADKNSQLALVLPLTITGNNIIKEIGFSSINVAVPPQIDTKSSESQKSTSDIPSLPKGDIFGGSTLLALKGSPETVERSSTDHILKKFYLDAMENIIDCFKYHKEMPRTILFGLLALLGMGNSKDIMKPLNRQFNAIMHSIF